MAEANILVAHDQFSCPVCLELLKDPVTIPCGHSYCMGCIKNYWDQTDHTGVYSYPQCRKTFNPRPDLCRNTMLAEVVEKLKKTGLNPPPGQSYAGPGDVSCDFCTGRKFKAVKSCLTCLASYCETHVKPHYEGAAFKRHKLINAIGNLEQKLCAEHQKVLDVFCRTDQTCVCVLCTDKDHKNHDTVSAEKERSVKQKQLGETQTEIQQRIQERLKEIEQLKQAVESLKNFQSLCAPPEAGDLPSVTVNTGISFGAVRKAVSELKDHIEDFCKGELITKTDSCQLTPDPNTAYRNLCLSEGNRKVTWGERLGDIEITQRCLIAILKCFAERRATLTKRRCRLYTGPGGAAQLRHRTWRSSTAEEQERYSEMTRKMTPPQRPADHSPDQKKSLYKDTLKNIAQQVICVVSLYKRWATLVLKFASFVHVLPQLSSS
ncbi:UNVERIFIED_CONTAM: hypothetical protein FKN15_025901 [Acipenser sinensis]